MKRILLGSFLAALALFVFGAVFWTSPIPYAYVEKAGTDDVELGRLLRNALPNDGVYIVPSPANPTETVMALHRQGPLATIHYHRGGTEPMSPSTFVAGFFHGWVTTFLLALLLHLAARPRCGQWLLLVALAGIAVTNYTSLGDGIYWSHPWPWLVLNAAYNAAAILIAGLVLSAIVKPGASPSPEAPANPA
ncbi:MAG: hypothetical protein KIT22_04375 [Verrucomicrobiae bacterium]|nr:hypothetical protein [Verrucomicrobiae bacterium]